MTDEPLYPPGLTVSDQAIFNAVLVPLRQREASFVRNYFANGKIAALAAKAAGYSEEGCNGKTAGYSKTHRNARIRAAIKAIDSLLTRRAIPGLPAVDVDAVLAAIPNLRARQANFVRCFYACGRDASKAMQMAGYADPSGGTGRRQLMGKQPVKAAISAIDRILETRMPSRLRALEERLARRLACRQLHGGCV